VAGNHDGAVAGRFSEDDFNEAAAAAILWTRGNMGLAEKQFLAQLRPVCEASEFCLVHGTLAHPEQFEYMLDVKHAKSTFELLKQKCCFVGHTHFPSLFVQDGAKIFQKDVSVSTASVRGELRAIVNCGSVGQPRDKDPRACCCIFDSDQASVTWHRVSYDHRSAARKIRQAGLPLSLADRLALGY
jgi:diadenosine tetraphosphatase ApaH/serine/threonine PP2A family protein phosphatase